MEGEYDMREHIEELQAELAEMKEWNQDLEKANFELKKEIYRLNENRNLDFFKQKERERKAAEQMYWIRHDEFNDRSCLTLENALKLLDHESQKLEAKEGGSGK